MKSLTEVLKKLKALITNELTLNPVCTRVMLRTGVNLKAPRPDQINDDAVVGKVIAALSDMGYAVKP